MMDLILEKEDLEGVRDALKRMLGRSSAECVLCIDRSGRLICSYGDRPADELVSLAALTAANFGATAAIANMLGEKNFSLHYHKGEVENIHFSAIDDDFLLITIFNNSTSLGLIRLEVEKTIQELVRIFS